MPASMHAMLRDVNTALCGLQTKRKYGDKRVNLLRACLRRELILLGRQRFLYIFRTGQARSRHPCLHKSS